MFAHARNVRDGVSGLRVRVGKIVSDSAGSSTITINGSRTTNRGGFGASKDLSLEVGWVSRGSH
jgi:hypothetical protein